MSNPSFAVATAPSSELPSILGCALPIWVTPNPNVSYTRVLQPQDFRPEYYAGKREFWLVRSGCPIGIHALKENAVTATAGYLGAEDPQWYPDWYEAFEAYCQSLDARRIRIALLSPEAKKLGQEKRRAIIEAIFCSKPPAMISSHHQSSLVVPAPPPSAQVAASIPLSDQQTAGPPPPTQVPAILLSSPVDMGPIIRVIEESDPAYQAMPSYPQALASDMSSLTDLPSQEVGLQQHELSSDSVDDLHYDKGFWQRVDKITQDAYERYDRGRILKEGHANDASTELNHNRNVSDSS